MAYFLASSNNLNDMLPQCQALELGLDGPNSNWDYCELDHVAANADIRSDMLTAFTNSSISSAMKIGGLTWHELDTQLKDSRIVVGTWEWQLGGSHCVVLYGTHDTGIGNYVLVFDPLPEGVGSQGWVRYDFYARNMGEANLTTLDGRNHHEIAVARTTDYFNLTPKSGFIESLRRVRSRHNRLQ